MHIKNKLLIWHINILFHFSVKFLFLFSFIFVYVAWLRTFYELRPLKDKVSISVILSNSTFS